MPTSSRSSRSAGRYDGPASTSARREETAMSSTYKSRVPKLCGADVELGNSVLGLTGADGTGRIASRLLLAEIDGLAASGGDGRALPAEEPSDPRDWARRFLPANGSCCYIDMDHIEVTTPEVLGAH